MTYPVDRNVYFGHFADPTVSHEGPLPLLFSLGLTLVFRILEYLTGWIEFFLGSTAAEAAISTRIKTMAKAVRSLMSILVCSGYVACLLMHENEIELLYALYALEGDAR